jgi:uncharacterized OB-fold protein
VPVQIPIVSYLVLDDGGGHLEAQSCESCGALFFDRRNACARCGGRTFVPKPLSSHGVVRSFTVVHRAPKGVPTPFVSAVVDLLGGGRVKANLLVDAGEEPDFLRMPVAVETFVAGVDSAGTEAVAFGFRPLSGRAA